MLAPFLALAVTVAFADEAQAPPEPSPVSHSVAEAASPESYWIEAPPEQATGDGNASAPDKYSFWDKLTDKAFDDFCKLVEIPLSYRLKAGDYAGMPVKYKRGLKRLPDGRWAVVDQAKLGLELGYGRLLADPLDASLSSWVGVRLEGESIVVRPTESKKSCKEIDRILNPLDAKTALPLSAERIAEMQVGELWKLPMVMSFGGRLTLSEIIEELPISLHFGTSAEGRSSLSLYRVSESELRFRLRLDQARIVDKGGGLLATIATYQIGLPAGEQILIKFISREASKILNRYLAASLQLGQSSREGVATVLEFVLDPRDPEQMRRLAQAAKGDLGVIDELSRMATAVKARLKNEKAAREDIARLAERHERELGLEPSFAGLDEYERKRRNFRFRLPLLFDFGRSKGTDDDRIVVLDEAGGEYDIHRADRRKENGLFDIPLLGQYKRRHKEQSFQVFTYKDGSGAVHEPIALYVEQEGFLRAGEGRAHALAHRAEEILKFVGTRGEGTNPRASLPMGRVAPTEPPSPSYRRGMSSFTLGFNAKAVAAIIGADAATVLKAFANTLEGLARKMLEWVLARGTLKDDEIVYDEYRLLEAMGLDEHRDMGETKSARSEIYWLCRSAVGLVKDLAAARLAPSAEGRAASFLKIVSGAGESDLAYDEILKVFVQLVDPLDLSGEYFTQLAAADKGKDVRARLVLHGAAQDPMLEAMTRARSRFAEPSSLSD